MKKRELNYSDLEFNAEEHVYTVNGVPFTSVTTFIKSHFPEFDADDTFWHGGLKRTFGMAEWTAYAIRQEIKGNGPVSKKYSDPYHYSKKLFRDVWADEVEARTGKKIPITQREVKKIWKAYGEASAAEGTRIHELLERYLLEEIDLIDILEEPRVLAAVTEVNKLFNKQGYPPKKPEFRVYSETYKLAGTIDLFLDTDGGFTLIDWKTNDQIKTSGGNYGETEATESLQNNNLQLYTLQLSLYAYILELEYNVVGCKELWIYHITNEGECIPISVPYQKEKIQEMLYEYECTHDL